MGINPITNGLSAIQRQAAAVDRASEKIVRSTAANVTEAPKSAREAETVAAQESGMVDGTAELIRGRRMFSAAVKMALTANEGISEMLRMGGYEGAQAA